MRRIVILHQAESRFSQLVAVEVLQAQKDMQPGRGPVPVSDKSLAPRPPQPQRA